MCYIRQNDNERTLQQRKRSSQLAKTTIVGDASKLIAFLFLCGLVTANAVALSSSSSSASASTEGGTENLASICAQFPAMASCLKLQQQRQLKNAHQLALNEKEKRKSAYMRFGRSAPVGEMSPVFMPWANDDAYFIGQQPEKRKSAYMRFGKRNGGHPVYDAGEFLGGGSFVPMQAGFVGNVGGDNAALFEPMEKRKSAYMRFGKRKSAYMRFGR